MKRAFSRLLFWIPRVLAIAFAAFISLFALDVFGENFSFWQTILALLIHLIPTAIILIILIIAWRWEWIGALLFISLGFLYLIMAWGKFHWSVYLAISGPLFLLGFLFLLSWIYQKKFSHTPPNPKSP